MRVESAHKIEEHKGKCKQLHGHSYQIILLKSYDKLNDMNMAEDFDNIGKYFDVGLSGMKDLLDHKYLNDVFNEPNLTAELLAKKIYDMVATHNINAVMVGETEHNFVIYDGRRWLVGKG